VENEYPPPPLPPDPAPVPELRETIDSSPVAGTATPAALSAGEQAVFSPVAATPEPSYRDQSTGLMVFGVLQILLGLCVCLMIPLMALGMFMSLATPGVHARPMQFFSGVATYGFMAASLIVLGIGSMRMLRWARALTVVAAWYWLVTGALVTVLLTAMLPVVTTAVMSQTQKNSGAPAPQISTGMMAVVLTIMIVVMAFFLVLVPLALVIFYSRRDVAETCRHRDPVERWTDRAPLPVLGASVVFLTRALYMLSVGISMPMFPLFGRYLSGIAGSAGFLLFASIDICLAVGIFRLRNWAWWLAVSTLLIRLISMGVTFARADLMQAYSKLGWSDQQVRQLSANPMLRGHAVLWWSLLSMVIFFGYVLWLKRYFRAPATTNALVPVSTSVG